MQIIYQNDPKNEIYLLALKSCIVKQLQLQAFRCSLKLPSHVPGFYTEIRVYTPSTPFNLLFHV